MLRHSLGGAVIFISLQHIIAPALDLMACLPSLRMREAIKVSNPRREQESAAKKVLLENLQVMLESYIIILICNNNFTSNHE